MPEHDGLVPLPVVGVADHLPHVARVPLTQLPEGRHLLAGGLNFLIFRIALHCSTGPLEHLGVGERAGEVVGVEVPVGGEVLQPQALPAGHRLPPGVGPQEEPQGDQGN